MNVLDDLVCNQHGWLRHTGVHEAGHSTIAAVLDIDFVDVSIYTPQSTFTRMLRDGFAEAGGVQMPTSVAKEWVGPRPDDALVFLLAGSAAEDIFWGHHLQDGYARDFEIWRQGTGRTGGQDPAEVGPVIRAGSLRARELVQQHRSTIERVFQLFVDQIPSAGAGGQLTLARDEVRDALGAIS